MVPSNMIIDIIFKVITIICYIGTIKCDILLIRGTISDRCSQLVTTHYVAAYKIIHVYFSYMTYRMSHLTSLNNTCG